MEKIFVYGTLMRGFGNHGLILDQKFLGMAFTLQPYLMTAGMIPFVSNSNEQAKRKAYILGEVYEVDKEALIELDALEGHPDWYERKKIDVRLDNGSLEKCWLYFNERDSGHTTVESGNFRLWRYTNGYNR